MRESTLWFWHIIAGAVVLVLLALHMGIMHLNDMLAAIGLGQHDPVDVASVFARSQHAFFMITYILLLGAALFHGFYGLRNILFELTLSRGMEKVVNIASVMVGGVLFIYGTYVAIAIFLMEVQI
jgi:succinate dehydrogenase / fumarate reductase membrane anchor subunit